MKFDLEKMKGKVIHCNTKEKADSLLIFLNSQNYHIGNMLLDNVWEIKKEQTCYNVSEYIVFHGSYNWYKDNDYTILEFEDVIIPNQPRICEILGVEVDEKFNLKNGSCNPYKLAKRGNELCLLNSNDTYSNGRVINLINNPELIEKIPQWTDKQKEIFKIFKTILGINYIEKTELGNIFAFESDPSLHKGFPSPKEIMINLTYWKFKDIIPFNKTSGIEIFEIPDV